MKIPQIVMLVNQGKRVFDLLRSCRSCVNAIRLLKVGLIDVHQCFCFGQIWASPICSAAFSKAYWVSGKISSFCGKVRGRQG